MITDYKIISFSRNDGINVSYKVHLNDVLNKDENFLVLERGNGIHTKRDINLFYWVDIKRWTLNEWIFFALNKGLCITIADSNNTELITYGICATGDRVFGLTFGTVFN